MHLGIEQPFDTSADLRAELELDSLKQLTLIVELENHFQTSFALGDEHEVITVGDLVALIRRRCAGEPD